MEISSVQHKVMETCLDEVLSCPKSQQQQEKKPRPQPEQSQKCPRCDSTNTKFCYYNNYNLSQPRYFCKGCRSCLRNKFQAFEVQNDNIVACCMQGHCRYWTKGGSLRNVPVGGGCRKNGKRTSSSSNSFSSSASSKKSQDQDLITTNSNPFLHPLPLPPLSFDPNDLTLAFTSLQNQPSIVEKNDHFMLSNPNPTPFLDILRGGYVDNNPSGSFQSLYYGFGGNVEEVDGEAVSGDHGHMMLSLDGGLLNGTINSTEAVTTTTTSTNVASGDHGGQDNKVVMGLHQWQLGGDINNNIHTNLGVDSTRDNWNGVGNSSWHGIINSSLM